MFNDVYGEIYWGMESRGPAIRLKDTEKYTRRRRRDGFVGDMKSRGANEEVLYITNVSAA